MPLYETTIIARQDISSTQVDALSEAVTAVIAEGGGAVKKREYWGLRTLSFRIKKNRKAHYVLLNIDAPAAAVTEAERTMRINEDVLRFLTIRVDALEEGPSAVMQSRGRSDDRPRRGFDDRPRDDRPRDDRPRDDRPREPREPAAAAPAAEGAEA